MSIKRVPVNLITGFLGAGKTTAVRHLLANKPAHEYWAVLVNEFGEVGIDGAAISDSADQLNVVEVPGGCICCTTSPMLRVSLTKLLRARRPDRLLIEPSGLGHPAGIIDLLRDPLLAPALDLRATITLVDPRHLDDPRYATHETWRDQIALADVLVGNKCERADADQVDRFLARANNTFPPKLAVVTTSQGRIDPSLLDALPRDTVANDAPVRSYRPVKPATSPHLTDDTQTSQGWTWSPEQRFNAHQLAALFQRLHAHADLGLPPVARAKGVFHTDHGWLLFNWVDGEANAVEIAWRRDSRCELIVSAAQADWATFLQALTGCLLPD